MSNLISENLINELLLDLGKTGINAYPFTIPEL
jgi:hypothetical protein